MISLAKKVVYQLITTLKSFILFNYQPVKLEVLLKMPYCAQWETVRLIPAILEGTISTDDDPSWRESGAKTKLDYLNWSWNGCGVACFQMILAYLTAKKVPLVRLGEQSLKYGVFTKNEKAYQKGNYLQSLYGLYYKPFLNFIRGEYKLKGRISRTLVIPEIIQELEKGNLVMASIGGPLNTSAGNFGHLVLVVGYNWNKKLLYVHNPSRPTKDGQTPMTYSFSDFNKKFNNRGIIVTAN